MYYKHTSSTSWLRKNHWCSFAFYLLPSSSCQWLGLSRPFSETHITTIAPITTATMSWDCDADTWVLPFLFFEAAMPVIALAGLCW